MVLLAGCTGSAQPAAPVERPLPATPTPPAERYATIAGSQHYRQNVEVIFVRQPELSTTGPHRKLLLAKYSYFVEAEREFISVRTKQGLATAKANGIKLGRPKGGRDKERVLDPHHEQIKEYLQVGLSLSRIRMILNPQLEKPLSYP